MPTEYVIETPSRGFGRQACGISAAGSGEPATIQEVADPSRGTRYLNPATGDYENDGDTGQLKQMPGTRQRVLLAIKTIRGSATANPRFGKLSPTKMGAQFEAEEEAAVRSALAHLTREDAPVIRIDDIRVTRIATGRSLTVLSYTDLTTGLPSTETF